MRHTGIEVIGDVPWGTHFCQFYETDQDLLETLVPYFKAGLEANEFCMWLTSEPLQVRQARAALKAAVPDLDARLGKGQIEILDYKQWYIRAGRFAADEALKGWAEKLDAALAKGYEGLRLSGNACWLEQADWEDYRKCEEAVDTIIGRRRMVAMCTYSLQKCGASEIIDVAANHEFALIKRQGRWAIIESASRKQAEEALKKEALKYSKVLQTAHAGFWIIDLEGKLLEVNDTYCHMSGYSRAQLLDMRLTDIEAKETLEEVQDHIRYVREHGHHQFESRHRRRDGTVFDAEIRASYLDIEGGRIVVFAWDISERKTMDLELRRERDFSSAVLDTAGVLVIVLDKEGRIRRFNRACQEITGYSEPEVNGRLFWELLVPREEMSGIQETWAALQAGHFPSHHENHWQAKDGSRRLIDWSGSALFLPDGGIEFVIGTGIDITERKRAEEELYRTREHLENLFDYANAPIIVWDTDFKITRFNHAFERLTGLRAEDVRGRPLDILFPATSRAESLAHIKRTLAGERWEVVEIPILRTDGAVRTVLWNSANVYDKDGTTITATIAQGQDITERKRMEEETRRLASFPMLNPQPVVEVDAAGRVSFANPAAQRLFPDLQQSGADHPWLADWKTLAAAFDRPEAVLPAREVKVGERWYHQSMSLVPGTRRLRIYGMDISSRVMAEEELRRHAVELEAARLEATNEKLRLEAVMEALPVGVAITDRHGGSISANRAYEQLWGAPRPATASVSDYAAYKAWWDDTQRPLAPEEWASARVLKKGEPVIGQLLEIQKFDGSRAHVINSAAPVRDAGGNLAGIAVAIQDITDLRRSQEAVRLRTEELQQLTETLEQRVRARTAELGEANELLQAEVTYSHFVEADLKNQKATLQTVIDNIPVMLCFFDSSGKARLTNREFKRLLGWSEEEAESLTALNWDAGEPGLPGPRALEAGGIPGWREHRIRTRAGEEMDSSWATVRLSDGGRIGIGLDMRERREAERERLRLAAAVEQADKGMAITDDAGCIIYANPAFETTSGTTRPGLLGRRYYDLLAGDGTDVGLIRRIEDSVRRDGIWSGQSTRKTKDGQSRELEISISPIRDRSGHIINNLVLEQDITREVRLQQQLRQAQKLEAIGTLAGGIAHDFNNILNPIFINTELALLDAALDEDARRGLELVLQAAERGRDLVKQITTFSRQKERGRLPAKIGPVLKEALEFLRSTLPPTIEIREDIEPETGFIMADPSQLHQVVMNLCHNSAYAMRERGGVLEVGLAEVEVDEDLAARYPDIKPGPFLRLSVTDTGTGMTPEMIDRIFDPFFTTKKPGEGAGMGLAVVHGIVRDYQGAVAVHSEVGKGTTFNIFFPRVPSEKIETPEPAEIPPSRSERILLVDDDEAQVQSMQSMLRRIGHHVVSRTAPEAALRVFRKNPDRFDLVITDQTMPRLTGEQLAREILRLRPNLPIILCTGFSTKVDADRADAMGIRGFLMKPFSIREMAAAIDRALKKD